MQHNAISVLLWASAPRSSRRKRRGRVGLRIGGRRPKRALRVGPRIEPLIELAGGLQDGEPPRTLVELQMCTLSAIIRAEREWWRKLTDPDTRARWLAWGFRHHDLNRTHIDYLMDELAGYSALRDEKTGIEVACCDRVWQSDALIPDALRDALKEGVKVLEDVPDDQKNWQPGENGFVRDLVHPSLYPLVYGRTVVRQRQDLQVAEAPEGSSVTSQRFAWLPTNFVVGASGAKALGYINNVHPSNTTLLTALESIVGAFVPLYERVLTDLLPENSIPLRVPDEYEWNEIDEQYSDESDNEYDFRYDVWYTNYRRAVLPDPPAYSGGIEKRARMYSLRGREIQVVVKLATINLTPKKPEYPSVSWHVEGMSNEHIVACGMYYYDDENIGKSRLAFRTAVSVPKNYHKDDIFDGGPEEVWGLDENGGLLYQELGSLKTNSGRCVAFPNIFQHSVTPFSLVDHTKPGHRKILAHFLVDPNVKIPSTSTVAPQQRDLLVQTLETCGGHMAKLPTELLQIITEKDTHTMTRAEAFAYREEVMDERTRFAKQQDNGEGFFAKFNAR